MLGNRIPINSHRLLINYKKQKGSFTLDKSGKYYLNQISKFNVIHHDTSYITYHLLWHSEKDTISLVVFMSSSLSGPKHKKNNHAIQIERQFMKKLVQSHQNCHEVLKTKIDWVIVPWIDKRRLKRHENKMYYVIFWLDPVVWDSVFVLRRHMLMYLEIKFHEICNSLQEREQIWKMLTFGESILRVYFSCKFSAVLI